MIDIYDENNIFYLDLLTKIIFTFSTFNLLIFAKMIKMNLTNDKIRDTTYNR